MSELECGIRVGERGLRFSAPPRRKLALTAAQSSISEPTGSRISAASLRQCGRYRQVIDGARAASRTMSGSWSCRKFAISGSCRRRMTSNAAIRTGRDSSLAAGKQIRLVRRSQQTHDSRVTQEDIVVRIGPQHPSKQA